MSLEIYQLHAHYGRGQVLFGVDLTMPSGSTTALVGRNGMGKTTLLRTITRRVPVESGTIRWSGRDLTQATTHEAARCGVAHMPQGTRVFSSLTVEETLRLAVRLASKKREDSTGPDVSIDEVYSWFPRLKDRRLIRTRYLSGGERQALSLSRCILTRPSLLLLDEPTEGLSPSMVQHFARILSDFQERGVTLLIVEQNLRFAVSLADHVHVLKNGVIDRSYSHGRIPREEEIRDAVMSV